MRAVANANATSSEHSLSYAFGNKQWRGKKKRSQGAGADGEPIPEARQGLRRKARTKKKEKTPKKQMRNKRKLNSTCGPKNRFLLPQLRNKPGAQRLTPSAQLRDDIRKPARFANVFAQYLAKWATLKATQPHPE